MQPRTVLFLMLFCAPLWAAPPQKPSVVPKKYDFVRTLEIEGGAYMWGKSRSGAQFGRLETRYLDPDVNAFVGLIGSFTRFNEDLRMGDPENSSDAPLIANWGAVLGIVRGAHTWAIDLMGTNLGEHLGFGPTFVGEHALGKHFQIFHRTAIDLFVGDTVVDSDQGLMWSPREWFGVTLGYRVFAMQHSNRNGPRAGLILHFNLPKMPFIFPSIG